VRFVQSDLATAAVSTKITEASERPSDSTSATLLEQILDQTADAKPGSRIDQFLAEPSLEGQLMFWMGRMPRSAAEFRDAVRAIGRDLAHLERLLSGQIAAVLHHPSFQKLESSWRGLLYLCRQVESARELLDRGGQQGDLKIRVLNVSKRELHKDFQKAIEFDQSALFKKVYEEEFGTAGGEPYGLLIGDYEFTHHPDDVDLLSRLTETAAAAFAPIVMGAAPQIFGLDEFSTLEQPINLSQTFDQLEYLKWRALRQRDESKFLGLTAPRILMRQPYQDDGSDPQGFRFLEDVEGPDRSRYLWGNAAWAFGAVVAHAYGSTSWLADIRGAQRGQQGGGVVAGLEVHSFQTDPWGVAVKTSTDVAIGDRQEKELCQLGFIPLSHCHDTTYSVFFANQSVHQPATYDDAVVTANARISSMLQYVLCASRFAHYLKIQVRKGIGSMLEAQELQTRLNRWLTQYVTTDEKAPAATKARFPLRMGQAEVSEIFNQPGSYQLKMHLLPHYQLDQLAGEIRLSTRIVEPEPTP
jgi:type VI secretion system ImpC/EvpB family protein